MLCRPLLSPVNLRLGQVSLIHSHIRQDTSGIGNTRVQKVQEISRRERIAEILNQVKTRDGLERIPSHVEYLVGRVSDTNASGSSSPNETKSLDLSDKTQFILASTHPVRYFLEREIYNHSKRMISYHHWVTLFGRGIQVSGDPKYDTILHHAAKASDVGMFSSDVHQCVTDVPENITSVEYDNFQLGNKYATLVGDFFAIKCISYIAKTKKSQAVMAITKGLEEFTTSSFASALLDKSVMYPILPRPQASVNDWIRYNKKASGYFNGGLYAAVLLNYVGLPKDAEFMKQFKTFSSNLSVFLKGVAEIDALKNAHDFSTVYPLVLVSLPAILYQLRNPGVFHSLRRRDFQIHTEEIKQLSEEIERSSVVSEAKFILGGMAAEAQDSFEKIAHVPYYANVVNELIGVISTY